jgi:hypothetical protein
LVLLLGLFVWIYASLGSAQDTLSVQVLRLLARANSWTAIQIFTVDPQISTIHTTAPTGTDCDATGETGKLYFDSTADFVYICSGVSGWRKITAAAP